MTFLEALYGSQYAEIKQNGKDPSKGRFNGNIFLTAFVMLSLVAIFLVLIYFMPLLGKEVGSAIKRFFGFFTGRALGKIIGAVLGGLFYFIIIKTVGTTENYNRFVYQYLQYPEETRNTANKRLLTPFFVALAVVIVFAFLVD